MKRTAVGGGVVSHGYSQRCAEKTRSVRARGWPKRWRLLLWMVGLGVLSAFAEISLFPCAGPGGSAPIVGFYNVFAQGEQYHRIVEEQMQQLAGSRLLDKASSIFYTATGEDSETFQIDEPKFVKMKAEMFSDEEVTLERMLQFCRRVPSAR
eukprot:scaffold7906_cov229-Pinguiococcus_pyrenoidosus.AAC.1